LEFDDIGKNDGALKEFALKEKVIERNDMTSHQGIEDVYLETKCRSEEKSSQSERSAW
jgi:hypothetical protein